MKRVLIKTLSLLLFGSFAAKSFAADELVVYVFNDGNAAAGLTAQLDGEDAKPIADDGSVYFDLPAGAHGITIFEDKEAIYNVRFNTAQNQFADISIVLTSGKESRSSIDKYFRTESQAERAVAARGVISGRLTSDGFPVANAKLSAAGTNQSTITDSGGNYRLKLPRGIYTLQFTDEFLGQQSIKNVRVIANIERGASFSIKKPVLSKDDTPKMNIEEMVVIARASPIDVGESERYSSGVVDTMDSGELGRFGGSDIAQSVLRIPSVTVKDGRFVFIRGLGGRYITTMLNGATLPSTDPSKRTVPLDLFPTNFVSQIDVKKSFLAAMPGESTGGTVVINTRKFPAESEGRISLQGGFTSELTGSTVWSDSIKGDYDWLGADDGSRSTAGTLRAISDTLDFSDTYPQNVEQDLGRIGALLISEDLDLDTETATPKVVFGANYGNVFELGSDGTEFGFFITGNYRNEWNQRIDGIEREYSGQSGTGMVELEDDFTFEEFSNEIESSGLLNLGLNVGNSSYESNTLISRVTQSRVNRKEGFDGDALEKSIRHTTDWVERQFLSQQISGNHILGDNERLVADWQTTVSRAERDAPDRREVRFDLTGSDGIYNLEVPDILRRFDSLVDNNLDATLNFDYLLTSGSTLDSTLSFGGQIIKRERDSDSESYGFTGGQTLDDNAPNLLVSDVINEDSITGDSSTGYTFQDKSLASDSYEADLDLNSLFLSYDVLIADSYQIVLGGRYEDFKQTTDTFSLQGADLQGETGAVRSELDESVFLPTLSFNWFLTESQTLRLGMSKTVSRPDFKETSNATFYDPDFDIRIRGNPNLEISDAINLDFRYQFYWNNQNSVSLGLFYKDFDAPIERVVQPASGTAGNTRTFLNADEAQLYGVEIEGRKDFDFGSSLTKTFFIAGNASLIESEVKLPNGNDRPLQGQPEYIVNLILGYDDIKNNQEITLLFNQTGDTIVDVGVSQQPDVILEPRTDLILNYRWYFADQWQLTFKAENLLDSEVEFTQGGNTYREFRTGRQFTFGVNFDF